MQDVRMESGSDAMRYSRLLTYRLRVRKSVSNRVRWYPYKDNEVLSVVVYNLIACLRKGSTLAYCRSKNSAYGVGRKKINPERVIKAVNFLENQGLITNHIGKSSVFLNNRSSSWIEPTDKFLNEWGFQEIVELAEQDYLEQVEVIELRDSDKKSISYRNSEHIERMSESVRNLNKLNESSEIRDGTGKLLTNIYCRIFNESFEHGGRFYHADVLAIKNRDDNARLDITIDGKPVVEIDYSNLHFRIAAAMEGLDSNEIPLDVYSGILEDEKNPIDRRIVKLAVNMMFNCDNEKKARAAIQKEINYLKNEEKFKFSLGTATQVMELVYRAYPTFRHLFCREGSFGRVLQNADSHLASDVLSTMVERGVPCLPVHDSFIVPLEHLNLLCNTMGGKFRERFGTAGVVPVGIKYRLDGVVQEDKVCT
jgi:hypothetical protein